MQNAYAYWRATHPLVFISFHLILGAASSSFFPQISFYNSLQLAIVILLIGIVLLLFFNNVKNQNFLQGLLVSIILVSWGLAIKFAAQKNNLLHIPYPNKFILICQNWVITKINLYIANKEANGFALAILLGLKSDINKELINAYTQLGIIHIVAISGMHLQILFNNLNKITQYFPKSKLFLTVELILLLLIVWTYTLMAFASPSIVRAALFFSFFTFGKFIGASSFVLNSIGGGLLVLLLFNVGDLSNIGLQLSYGAVIGIHLFYKLFFSAIELHNPIIKFLWSNCCMSLAAQLTTLPILALHFHQIAGWVLVSNFIMVPLSNFILYGLAILLLLPNSLFITHYWGQFMEKYILYFNNMVSGWFQNTKAGSILITMHYFDILFYYLILLFVYLWVYLKRPNYLIWTLVFICVYLLRKLFS